MKRTNLLLTVFVCISTLQAQVPVIKANYSMASRFSPKKLEKLLFTIAVDPHWLKKSDRFWYTYETSAGKNWYIVDAAKGQKQKLFDNAKLAAQLTAIVKDPMDAQHLVMDSMRFVKDENWIQFEVKSTQDVEKVDSVKFKAAKDTLAKKELRPHLPEKKRYSILNTIL